MAWTTPASWSTNEVVTAAKMNTHVRDNISFLGSPPGCSVRAAGPQSVANATEVALTADTELFDNDTMHSTVSNTSRITATTAGRYLVCATVRFASNATGVRAFGYRVNGGATQVMGAVNGAAASDTSLSGSKTLNFAAADFVEVFASQASGGSLNVTLEDFTATMISVP
jgi:hypothetical protein